MSNIGLPTFRNKTLVLMVIIIVSGGYSDLGARGKNFQKLMLSEKKKRSDLGLHIFLRKSRCSLKKKGLHFSFISDFPIFHPKSRCSLKKKKKGLHFDFIFDFPIFLPKSRYSLKKKKVFTSISSLISLFFSQNQGVL